MKRSDTDIWYRLTEFILKLMTFGFLLSGLLGIFAVVKALVWILFFWRW